jgi:hypothetical protein
LLEQAPIPLLPIVPDLPLQEASQINGHPIRIEQRVIYIDEKDDIVVRHNAPPLLKRRNNPFS